MKIGERQKQLLALLVVVFSALSVYSAILIDVHVMIKAAAVLAILFVTSKALAKLLSIEEEFGLILARTEKFLGLYDQIAKISPDLWRSLADLGLVLGFGIASIFIFKSIPKKTFFIGIIFLLLFSQIILPTLSPIALEMINLPASAKQVNLPGAELQVGPNSLIAMAITLVYYFVSLAGLFLGLAGSGLVLMGLKTLSILFAVSTFISNAIAGNIDAGSLATEGPGAAPIIPGINLPLIEGILALIVMLVVHESAHAVLARVEEVKLKNAGLVFLGILPFGAFVEPDEAQMKKIKPEKQNRILVAGSTANLLTAVLFFFLLAGFQWAIMERYPDASMFEKKVYISQVISGWPAENKLLAGMEILQWNGKNITTLNDFYNATNGTKENDTVVIVTNINNVTLKAGKYGKVGVYGSEVSTQNKTFSAYARELSDGGRKWVGFIYNFLGLGLVLNVLVGIVNLFPIPPFDGFRIMDLTVKKKKLVNFIVALTIVMFLVNLMPWAWA